METKKRTAIILQIDEVVIIRRTGKPLAERCGECAAVVHKVKPEETVSLNKVEKEIHLPFGVKPE